MLYLNGLHPFHMACGMHLTVACRAAGRHYCRRLAIGDRQQERRRDPRRSGPPLEYPTVRLVLARTRDGCTRARTGKSHLRGGTGRRADGTNRGQDLCGLRWGSEFRRFAAAVGKRPASQRIGQLIRAAGPQLHGSQQHVLSGRRPKTAQRHRMAENARAQ